MKQGDCFFNKAAPRLPSHLWVIVSQPDVDEDNVLIVNLTDVENHHDLSCVLDASDHPGIITKRSCVAYQFAKITSLARLQEALSSGLLYSRDPVPSETLAKIINGAQETDELRGDCRELLRGQFLIT